MAFFSGLKRRLKTDEAEPTTPDLAVTQARGLTDAVDEVPRPTRQVEPKPAAPAPVPTRIADEAFAARLDDIAAQLQRIEQVSKTPAPAAAPPGDLGPQLAAVAERLPIIERSLADMQVALEEAREREDVLARQLTSVDAATDGHTAALAAVREQVQTSRERVEGLAAEMDQLQGVLTEARSSAGRAAQARRGVETAADRRETEMRRLMLQTKRWLVATLVCCAGTALAALGIAVAAVLR